MKIESNGVLLNCNIVVYKQQENLFTYNVTGLNETTKYSNINIIIDENIEIPLEQNGNIIDSITGGEVEIVKFTLSPMLILGISLIGLVIFALIISTIFFSVKRKKNKKINSFYDYLK